MGLKLNAKKSILIFAHNTPKMKRKSNYKAKNRGGGMFHQSVGGGRRNPRLRPVQKPVEKTVGWAAKLVNDPLELACFAGLVVFVFVVVRVLF